MEDAAAASETVVCKFCDKGSPGRYTCPRCNARYCCADCYKCETHSACSELFYRDCFMEGLRDMEPDGNQRQRIVEMLHRLEADDVAPGSESDEDENDLEERFAGVNLDGPPDEIWQRLTENERREFDRFIGSGQLTEMIPLWTPWWNSASLKPLVEDLSSYKPSKSTGIPAMLTNIPDISKLSQKSGISELIPFTVVNVLYGYAYSVRLYNGDHFAMAVECAQVISDISESVERGIFQDAAAAVACCLSRLEGNAKAREHFVSREYSVAVVQDVCRIISGPSESQPLEYVVAALSDCCRVFKKARRAGDDADTKRLFFAGQKKLEFLLSWVVSSGCVLQTLLPALELESCELTTHLVVHRSERDRMERALEQRKLAANRQLITEIPYN